MGNQSHKKDSQYSDNKTKKDRYLKLLPTKQIPDEKPIILVKENTKINPVSLKWQKTCKNVKIRRMHLTMSYRRGEKDHIVITGNIRGKLSNINIIYVFSQISRRRQKISCMKCQCIHLILFLCLVIYSSVQELLMQNDMMLYR